MAQKMNALRRATGALTAALLIALTPISMWVSWAASAEAVVTISQHDTVPQIRQMIQSAISATAYGGTVTVLGGKAGVGNGLSLDISNSVKVVWKADYIAEERAEPSVPLLSISGKGTFEVAAGFVTASGFGVVINATEEILIVVSGGEVKGNGNRRAISSSYGVVISGGIVSTDNFTAISSSGLVSVSGGSVSSVRGIAISASGDVHVSGGEITVHNGDSAIYTNKCKATMTGGSIVATAYNGSACYGIRAASGGIIIEPQEGDGPSPMPPIYPGIAGDVVIAGGTIAVDGNGPTVAVFSTNSDITLSNCVVTAKNGDAVYSGSGNVAVLEGARIHALSEGGKAIYVIRGDIAILGGEIAANGSNGAAISTSSGTIAVTGGAVSATGENGMAIQTVLYGAAAFLDGACTGGYSSYNGQGLIVRASSLAVPDSWHGTANGLDAVAGGGNAEWRIDGGSPSIAFNLGRGIDMSLPWVGPDVLEDTNGGNGENGDGNGGGGGGTGTDGNGGGTSSGGSGSGTGAGSGIVSGGTSGDVGLPATPSHSFADANNEYAKGSQTPLVVIFQKDISIFRDAQVGGDELTRGEHYKAEGDQTIITLFPNYLDTLPVGEHALEVSFTDGANASAAFTVTEGEPEGTASSPAPWENPFADVDEGDWFYEAVKYAHQNGLVSGMSATTFSPHDTLTRGMLVTILWNHAGRLPTGGSAFADVEGGSWYADAVNWAAANGVVAGYGDGLFGPGDEITREQMAVMLHNYANLVGAVLPSRRVGAFADVGLISPWAKEAVGDMYAAEVLNGKGENNFDPQGEATRAEVVAMMRNFLESIITT